ncbi:helix-turn-helix domain-containing protein [Pedobacter sp. SYP-B3415]|uniref:winged helix-turn-helix transcriptional regulator n=1 Tax=Pedobacter sp. SYP-B3415 TaxID=2496641 RepID=UPI00101DEE42|nr:helix-turn-helix domain-containing protein [Pedobacter sp. SYP-B3415]
MTTHEIPEDAEICPAQALLKMLSGKWKAEIFRLATERPLRFSTFLRSVEGASKQSLSTALREMENDELIQKTVIREKPLHIEYTLTSKGQQLVSVFRQLEGLS